MQALHGLVIAWSRFLERRRCRTALGVGKVLCAQTIGGRPKIARMKTLLLCLIEDRFCMIGAEAISSPSSNKRFTVRQRSEKLRMCPNSLEYVTPIRDTRHTRGALSLAASAFYICILKRLQEAMG